MLAQHLIDIERGPCVGGGIDSADLDMGPVIGGVDLLHILARHRKNLGAWRWIAGDATPEIKDTTGQPFLVALTQEVDVGNDALACLVQHHRAHAGDQPDRADAHLDLTTDLARHRGAGVHVLPQ